MFAHFVRRDHGLMRFDPPEGASFDVLLEGRQTWLCNHLHGAAMAEPSCASPHTHRGPFSRLNKEGLDGSEGAPYENGSQRYAGIIRTVDTPSF